MGGSLEVPAGIQFQFISDVSATLIATRMTDTAKKGGKSVKTGGKKLPAVPEFLLKRKKKNDEARVQKLRAMVKYKYERQLRKKEYFKRAEKYAKEYSDKDKAERIVKRRAGKNKSFYVPDEPKLAFAIRIRGVNGIAPKPRKVLQLFRLRQINNGVFFKINKATMNMLRIAEPHITWGYPSLSTIRNLVLKRGFLKIFKKRIPLVNNEMIEHKLRKFNMICVEDLVHEIYTCGPYFREATRALWPFKLNNPTGGWRRKTRHFVEGGDFGNREQFINELLKKMI